MPSAFTEVHLQLALDAAHMEVWDSDVVDCSVVRGTIYWSARGAVLIGLPPQAVQQPFTEFLERLHAEDRDRVVNVLQQAVDARSEYTVEYRVVLPDGRLRWLCAKARVFVGDDNVPLRTLGIIWDITDRKDAAHRIFEHKELAEVTLGSIADGVITTDATGQVTYLNRPAEDITGWKKDDAVGQHVNAVFRFVNQQTKQTADNSALRCLALGQTVSMSPRGVLVARDGREIAVEESAAPIRSRDGHMLGAVLVFHDVSHEQRLRHELSWQASHDALTGLINRREFEAQVGSALASARNEQVRHALLFLDLDQFKIVNDTSGHAAGDELLRQLAHLLQGRMRENDVLSRLGGDELGVLLRNCPLDQAQSLANELRQTVRDFRFVWDRRNFEIGVSIGLVEIDASSKSLTDVLSAADRACYVAKEQGRNRVHLFRESDVAIAHRFGEMLWVARLNDAFKKESFHLYSQPIIKLVDGVGHDHVEILVRMNDETDGMVLPGAFIPAAERYDLMPTLDRWVIRNVFRHIQQQRLRDAAASAVSGITTATGVMAPARSNGGAAAASIATAPSSTRPTTSLMQFYAINLSGTSLNDDGLLDFIDAQLACYGVHPGAICFEITETAAIGNLLKARVFMQEVKKRGCRFALDDFGSGLSSFSYLKNLPVDFLKIDGSFVREVATDPIIRAMVTSINEVGHVMGIETIAEYVENASILQQVRDIGIDYAQGYAFGMPQRLV